MLSTIAGCFKSFGSRSFFISKVSKASDTKSALVATSYPQVQRYVDDPDSCHRELHLPDRAFVMLRIVSSAYQLSTRRVN